MKPGRFLYLTEPDHTNGILMKICSNPNVIVKLFKNLLENLDEDPTWYVGMELSGDERQKSKSN